MAAATDAVGWATASARRWDGTDRDEIGGPGEGQGSTEGTEPSCGVEIGRRDLLSHLSMAHGRKMAFQ